MAEAGRLPENPVLLGERALIDGTEYVFAHRLSSVSNGPEVVVCSDGFGGRRYATEDEWLAGAERYAAQPPSPLSSTLTMHSSAERKIALMRLLFKGREDVYAGAYVGKLTGKLGYSPVCENRWDRSLCDCRNVSCAQCPNRHFAPLTDEVVQRHLLGKRDDWRDAIGVYVVREGDKVCFLAADFDGPGWHEEVAAYRDACRDQGIPVAVERSRSGDGGHVWIFFEEEIDARLARNLGGALVTLAMRRGGRLDFRAYDRLFPAQDRVPKGGFGSLIALPLQGRARRAGNSVFVDDSFEPYPDQWRFLSTVGRVGKTQAKRVASSIGASPLGELVDVSELEGASDMEKAGISDDAPAPSSGNPARPVQLPLSSLDFPATVHVTLEDKIYVDREGFSAAGVDRVRRLAAIANPEFYLKQAMRMSVWKTPRVLYFGEDTDDAVALPRGCQERLFDLLSEADVPWAIEDRRNPGRSIRVSFVGELRPGQDGAVEGLLRHENGILEAPTGFGKTVVAACLIARRKVNTLVLVPTSALLAQWRAALGRFLDIDEELPVLLTKTGRPSRAKRSVVGQIGDGKNLPSGIVDVALYQSLFEKGDIAGERRVKELVRDYGMVICDECHHVAAPRNAQVVGAVRARYVYGLTATPKRKDGLNAAVFMLCGPVRYRPQDAGWTADVSFKRYLVPRFTQTALDEEDSAEANFARQLELLGSDELRNRMLVDDADALIAQGRTPLVLTRLVAHARLLADDLAARGRTVFVLTGSDSRHERQEKVARIHALPPGERFAVVATGSYVGEGFDEARLDALLLAAPVSWEGLLTQYTGRLHRSYEGKRDALVFDYVDVRVPALGIMYRKRLKAYAKLGYAIPTRGELQSRGVEVPPGSLEDDGTERAGAILGPSDCGEMFERDLVAARRTVLVSSSYVNDRRIRELSEALATAVGRGVRVAIVAREPREDEKYCRAQRRAFECLESLGCAVKTTSSTCPDWCVVDGKTVWYGGVDLLGFSAPSECSLRFASVAVARDLEDAAAALVHVKGARSEEGSG